MIIDKLKLSSRKLTDYTQQMGRYDIELIILEASIKQVLIII